MNNTNRLISGDNKGYASQLFEKLMNPDSLPGQISLCKPTMGYSFAAGTTDGPGMFDFKQGDTSTNIFWNTVRNLLQIPTAAQVACHHPKPILLDTGENNVWQKNQRCCKRNTKSWWFSC
ncbi:neutral ceramidase-like isoform X2 [Gigantopelta aegis]|uniref:neutral ceramidase-like isoform X2 n=1 Tax=Gigantopelta aegis TaxID=1735272 RepID=UPI001B88BED0|nr:neutral ceramidase-like isoform X2 [Gigantopelta aegis]XP_041379682.1 neutral ceramidase-like isoform X2 [Gigantopelta aegis]XP_041379683.1 neutral ceramidase-like isoform X2 [Gigantopelta aegis]XP_041379684.1 neutral ceramidase-like isoform X2 [Gigantopelta aegis]